MTSLHQKTSHALFWSAIEVFLRQGVQFIVLMVLARILAPEDFGVIAVLALFVGIATIFIDSGFGAALIQRQATTVVEESTVFFFNLVMGGMVALTICIIAPWVARFFNQPLLRDLSYIFAFNVFVNAFGSIHTTLLSKELNFKVIAKAGGVASLLSGVLAIVLAMLGFGVWSLAWQALSASLVTVVLLWVWHPWRPVRAFSFSSLRSFFRFGGFMMANSLVDTLHLNLNSVLIGKYYSMSDVGLYDRAQKTQMLPVGLTSSIIDRVMYPVFSAAATDTDRLARGYRKVQRLVMLVHIPLLIGMIILAEPLVKLLFGAQWLPCAPILQVLGFVGIMWPLHVLNLNILKAQGRSDLFFNITLLKKSIAIGLTVVASFYGVMAMAWAQVFASMFAFVVNAHYSKVFLNYGALKQLQDLMPSLIAALPAAMMMLLVSYTLNLPSYAEIIITTLVGGAVYLLSCRLIGVEALEETVALLKIKS